MTQRAFISIAWRFLVPKYPLVGITEADAAEAARDTWDGIRGTRPNMPKRPGACPALHGA